MRTPLRLLALCSSAALALTDCSKKGEPEPVRPSQREQWLTGTAWRLVRFDIEETSPAGVTTVTNYPLTAFDPCTLDDYEYFHTNKVYEVDEGATRCTISFMTTGVWQFTANETGLLRYNPRPGTPAPAAATAETIRNLSATGLTLAAPPSLQGNGDSWVFVRTYAAR